MKLNLLESVLLGIIVRRPSAGYDIRKYLEREGRIYGYVPQVSQIYRQLATLVSRELLEFEIDTDRSGPDAKVYSPTPSGYTAFLAWVDAPFEPSERPLDAHFQVHYTLAGSVSPVVALRIVETELAYRVEQEASWHPDFTFGRQVSTPFDPDWVEELSFLADARGNQLATSHISWLLTTGRRLRRFIDRTGAVWPDPRWAESAAGTDRGTVVG